MPGRDAAFLLSCAAAWAGIWLGGAASPKGVLAGRCEGVVGGAAGEAVVAVVDERPCAILAAQADSPDMSESENMLTQK